MTGSPGHFKDLKTSTVGLHSNAGDMESVSPSRPENPQSPADRATPSTHVALIDWLRLLAMFDIVAFHALGPLPFLNGLGLPTFLLLSVAFSVVSVERHGIREIAARKLSRIGIPWLCWWAMYAVFFVLLAIRRGEPPAEVFKPLMVIYGPSDHLWFCPFIILAGLAVAGLHQKTQGHTRYLKTAVTLTIAYALLLVLSSEDMIGTYGIKDAPVPFWQWYFSAPALLLGLALGQVLLISRKNPRWMAALALISVLIAGLSIGHLDVRHIFRRYAVSFAIITVAFVVGQRFNFRDWLSTKLTPTMLGVYLIHIIFIYLFYVPLHNHHFLFTLVTFAVSVVAIAILHRTKLRIFT